MPSTATTSSSTYSEIKKHFNMTVQIRQLVQCSNKDHKKCSFPIRLMAFYVEYEKREAQSGSMWIWRLVYRIKRGIGTVNHGICRHIHVAYCMALNRSKIVFYLGFFFSYWHLESFLISYSLLKSSYFLVHTWNYISWAKKKPLLFVTLLKWENILEIFFNFSFNMKYSCWWMVEKCFFAITKSDLLDSLKFLGPTITSRTRHEQTSLIYMSLISHMWFFEVQLINEWM